MRPTPPREGKFHASVCGLTPALGLGIQNMSSRRDLEARGGVRDGDTRGVRKESSMVCAPRTMAGIPWWTSGGI